MHAYPKQNNRVNGQMKKLFREAQIEDLPKLVALLMDDELGQRYESSIDLTPYEQAFKAILLDPNHLVLIIASDHEILGCVQISYLPNLTFKGTWRAQLEGVRIAKKHRGRGLDKQLIKEAIALAKARGCEMMQLTTNKSRLKTVAFYESLGFQNTHDGMKQNLNS